MTPASGPDLPYRLGFAVGLGLCAVALIGLPVTFWLADTNDWLIYGAAFLAGAVLGALLAPRLRDKWPPAAKTGDGSA